MSVLGHRLRAYVPSRTISSPTDISGLQLWFDSDDAASFSPSQWNDKSGNARHVYQGYSPDQPVRDAVYGAKTAVRFRGDANVQMYMEPAVTLAQPYTILVVAARYGAGTTSQRTVLGNRDNVNAYLAIGDSSLVSAYAGGGTATQGSTPADDTLQQLTGVFNGSSSRVWGNGTAGSVTDIGTISLRMSCVGGLNLLNNHLKGHIGEIVVYNTALSDTDREAVQTYLKSKWGTP